MAIVVDYASLQSKIAGLLVRSDVTQEIKDAIAAAEARIFRRVRTQTVVGSLTIDTTGIISLPADLQELRYLRLNDNNYHWNIDIVAPTQVADVLDRWNGAAGTPQFASVIQGKLYVAPLPMQSYAAQIIYYQAATALSDSNTTNFILTAAPDVYIAGTMVEMLLFLNWDDRVQLWEEKFQTALVELERQREQQEFAAAPAPVRLPVVFE